MIRGKQYTPADVLAIVIRRKWLAIGPLIVAGTLTAVVSHYLPNRYRAETMILVVPQRVPESYVKSTVTSSIEDRLPSISQQIMSRSRLERIINDFNLYADQRRTGIMEDIIQAMRHDIDVQIVKGDAFRVSFTGRDPRTVKKVTERLASLFIEENLRDRAVLAEDSYQFLEAQLEDARRRLVDHEKKLAAYQQKYSGQLPSQLESNMQMIQNLQMQVQALNESVSRDRDRRLMLERMLADATAPDAVAATGAPSPNAPSSAARQLEAARQALAQLQEHLTPQHPDVIRTKRMIAELEAKAAAEAVNPKPVNTVPTTPAEVARQRRVTETRAEIENLDRQIARKEADQKRLHGAIQEYQARVEATPTRASEMTELTRDYDTLQKTYASLLTKREDSKVAANLERRQIGEQFKMLDPAHVPERPFWPNRTRINAMGAAFGLALGIALIALLEYTDTTLKSDDDVVCALALPVLALVPLIRTEVDRRAARRRLVYTVALAGSALVLLVVAAVMVMKFRA